MDHGITGIDLFGLGVLNNPALFSRHLKLMATMLTDCAKARKTPFHLWMEDMAKKEILKHHITMNIDILDSQYPSLSNVTLKLHGSISEVRCPNGCLYSIRNDHLKAFKQGVAPLCDMCNLKSQNRVGNGRRSLSVPKVFVC